MGIPMSAVNQHLGKPAIFTDSWGKPITNNLKLLERNHRCASRRKRMKKRFTYGDWKRKR